MELYPRHRQSTLARFDRCGLTVRFDEKYGAKGWTSHDAARGQIFHRVAAKCIEEMAAQGEGTIQVDVALAILEECLRQHDVDELCPRCASPQVPVGKGMFRCTGCHRESDTQMVALPAEQIRHLRISVIKWANDQAGAKTTGGGFNIDHLVSVEERLFADITYPSDFGPITRTITGQTDAMFFSGGRAIVPDWKDTWGLPPETELSFSGYFQQRCYAFLIFTNHRAVQSVVLREVYHRFNETREATISREDLPNIRAELSALVERFDRCVEQELWRPSPGKHCSFCVAPQKCPIDSVARGEGGISSEKEARRLAAELCVADTVAKRHRAALKSYANRTGKSIPVSDAKARRAYGFRYSPVMVKPDQETIEREVRVAASEGRDPNIAGLYRKRGQTRFELIIPEDSPQPTAEDSKLSESLRASLDSLKARQDANAKKRKG
jgi:hypothetical protein